MRNKEQDTLQKSEKRRVFLETAFSLFSGKNIDSVSMQDVADKSGFGVATLYRYFGTKAKLVVETASAKWAQFLEENRKRRPTPEFEGMTAREEFIFYLDTFLWLYRDHRDLLRFNQFFNIYVQSEKMDRETMEPYQRIIETILHRFHTMWEKASLDHTLRTDFPEQEVFSTTLHLMLAAVTRYAVGLVFQPEKGFDPERELEIQKEALLFYYGNGCSNS